MIFRSPFPDVDIPSMPLTDYVLQDAIRHGGKPALIDGPSGRSITFADLAGGVDAAAAGLQARGLRKGEVVGIHAPNLPEYAVAFHAILRAGATATLSNPLYTPEELARQLADSRARFLITIPPLLQVARAAAALSLVEEIYVFGDAEGAAPFVDLLKGGGAPTPVLFDPAEQVAALPYSSGTTGLPKGVMLTHRNLVANVVQTMAVESLEDDEVVLGILPLFHSYGLTVLMNMVVWGKGTLVTLPRFEMESFLATLQDHRISRAYLVPPLILALAKDPRVDRYDLSALRWINSGAAPLSGELAAACAERVGAVVRQGYGLTETSPVTHFVPMSHAGRKPASVGPAIPNTEVMVVDASGEPQGPGARGEIWIRGPQVMKGYLGQPEATERMLSPEGWLRTGDIGYVDGDGDLFIVDRAKELIKYKGFQVAPAELEAVLLEHPAVADAAVIGIPDEAAGEIPKAFVVARGSLTEADVMAWVAARVAPMKKVRAVAFREDIPKSASGKILRRVLAEEERGAREAADAEAAPAAGAQ